MPIYAFSCTSCGLFDVARAMADAAEPAPCPTCGGQARRVFTPPGLPLLAKPVRRAFDLEEKSTHEPEVVTQKKGRPMPHVHARTPPWVLGH